MKFMNKRFLNSVRSIFRVIFLLHFLVFPLHLSKAGAFDNLSVSLAGDLVFQQAFSKESKIDGHDSKFKVRSAEMAFYAPIDHQFDAFLSFAAHEESGVVNAELHELYFSSSKLIPRTRFKVGQFFLGIGRLNRFHQHDWYFTTAPKIFEELYGDEGVFDAGLEFSYLLPMNHFLELTMGVTSGYNFGHTHSNGKKPKLPTHYARLATSFSDSTSFADEIGVNYLRRKDSLSHDRQSIGLDLTFKWKKKKFLRYLIQSEAWFNETVIPGQHNSKVAGVYLYNQYAFNPSWSVGLMLDAFKDLNLRDVTGVIDNNIYYNFSPNITYASSEFFKSRLSYGYSFSRIEGKTRDESSLAELQFTLILGDHPSHDF